MAVWRVITDNGVIEMADQEKELKGLRDKIDSIDGKILELISARAAVAQEVARVKEAAGTTDAFFYRPEREAQVLRRIMSRNDGTSRR